MISLKKSLDLQQVGDAVNCEPEEKDLLCMEVRVSSPFFRVRHHRPAFIFPRKDCRFDPTHFWNRFPVFSRLPLEFLYNTREG